MIFLQLFCTFFIIGAFTFGGGYAMLSLIQNQVVTVHQWLTPEEFTDIVAISQMSPGPIGATRHGFQSCHKHTRLADCDRSSSPALIPAGAVDLHPLREIQDQPLFCGHPESNAPGHDRHDRSCGHHTHHPLQLHRLVELDSIRRSLRRTAVPKGQPHLGDYSLRSRRISNIRPLTIGVFENCH